MRPKKRKKEENKKGRKKCLLVSSDTTHPSWLIPPINLAQVLLEEVLPGIAIGDPSTLKAVQILIEKSPLSQKGFACMCSSTVARIPISHGTFYRMCV